MLRYEDAPPTTSSSQSATASTAPSVAASQSTTPTPTLTTSPKTPVAAIAGGVAGGIVLVALLLLALFLCIRRRDQKGRERHLDRSNALGSEGFAAKQTAAPLTDPLMQYLPVTQRVYSSFGGVADCSRPIFGVNVKLRVRQCHERSQPGRCRQRQSRLNASQPGRAQDARAD